VREPSDAVSEQLVYRPDTVIQRVIGSVPRNDSFAADKRKRFTYQIQLDIESMRLQNFRQLKVPLKPDTFNTNRLLWAVFIFTSAHAAALR